MERLKQILNELSVPFVTEGKTLKANGYVLEAVSSFGEAKDHFLQLANGEGQDYLPFTDVELDRNRSHVVDFLKEKLTPGQFYTAAHCVATVLSDKATRFLWENSNPVSTQDFLWLLSGSPEAYWQSKKHELAWSSHVGLFSKEDELLGCVTFYDSPSPRGEQTGRWQLTHTVFKKGIRVQRGVGKAIKHMETFQPGMQSIRVYVPAARHNGEAYLRNGFIHDSSYRFIDPDTDQPSLAWASMTKRYF